MTSFGKEEDGKLMNRRRARPIVWVAAAALVDRSGRVLLAQRPQGKAMAGQWEFPGGKVESGERPAAALARELREELGIVAVPEAFAPLRLVSHAYEDFHLLMPLFLCRHWTGTPAPLEGQTLLWADAVRVATLDWVDADRPLAVPIVALLRAMCEREDAC